MSKKIPIIFCVDVEPDPRQLSKDSREPWAGYEAMHAYLQEMRPRLEKATGSPVHFSWFYRVDPQIADTYGAGDWAFQYYKEWIREYAAEGDEIGLHPHGYRGDEKGWIVDHGNQVWVEHCLDMAFEGFHRNLGYACRSFRFGDRWMNQETFDYLEKKGVCYELTLEPGYPVQKSMNPHIKSERATGSLPDTTRMPNFPYRAKPFQYQSPDASCREGMWVIPLSTGQLTYQWGRTERIFKSLFQPDQVKPKNMTLNLGFGINNFLEVVRQLLEVQKLPYLAIVARTDVAVRENLCANMEAHLENLMNHPLRECFVFSTPKEAIDILGYEGRKSGLRGQKEKIFSDIKLQTSDL